MTSRLSAAVMAAGILTLVSATSAAAQVYEWSPQKTSATLTGTLTFVPDGDHGASFQCKVSLSFRTGNIRRGADALPHFESVTVKGRGCETVVIYDLPWYAGPIAPPLNGMNGSASLSAFQWNTGRESCSSSGGSFHVSPDGKTWLFDSTPCLTGSLTVNPPVTIVQAP